MNYLVGFGSEYTSRAGTLPLLKNERLHAIIDSRTLAGVSLTGISGTWEKLTGDCEESGTTETPAVFSIKTPRVQRESDFKITFNETEFTPSVRLRFRIVAVAWRTTGGITDLFGTFTEQATSLDEYITKVQTWLQSKTNVRIVRRAGSTLYVRLNTADYANQQLLVDIGTGAANTNTPTLTFTTGSNFTSSGETEYDIVVGASVVPGNIYTLDTTVVTAVAGDTAETIKYKLSANGKFKTNLTNPTVTAQVGTQTQPNTNNATLEFTYRFISSVAQWAPDIKSYKVTAGNVFTWANVTYTVTGSEASVGAIKDTLYNTATKFPASGNRPTWLFARGQRAVPNTNTPTLTLANPVTIPSGTYTPRTFTVGASIAAGNTFTINGQTLTVYGALTALDVAKQLQELVTGTTLATGTNPFTINFLQGTSVTASAAVGVAINTNERIAKIETSDYVPALNTTPQYWLQVQAPTTAGCRRLNVSGILSQTFEVLDDTTGTVLIEAVDDGNVFGYEADSLFALRHRIWGGETLLNVETEETEITRTDGRLKRDKVRIRNKKELVFGQMPDWFHDAMSAITKFRNLYINGAEVYTKGTYTLPERVKGTDFRAAKIMCEYVQQVSDNELNLTVEGTNYDKILVVVDESLRRNGVIAYATLNNTWTELKTGLRMNPQNFTVRLLTEYAGNNLPAKYQFLLNTPDPVDINGTTLTVSNLFFDPKKLQIRLYVLN